MAFHQIHDDLDGSRPAPTSRHRGLPLAGLFLCGLLLLAASALASSCSQPEPREEARSGAEAAQSAGEATRKQPSPVQYRTNTSDAGTSDTETQADDNAETDAEADAEQSTPDAE
jgi:hypothetical protein